jgi:hypothetical protein
MAMVVLVASACGAESAKVPAEPFVANLTLWNRSSESPEQPNFLELLEVRVHDGQTFLGSPNLLDEPLAIDARVVIVIKSGQYLTVIRRKNTGQNIAITTGEPLQLSSHCHVLEVFDDGFRLTEDVEQCNPPADGGPTDGGPEDGQSSDGGPSDGGDT